MQVPMRASQYPTNALVAMIQPVTELCGSRGAVYSTAAMAIPVA